MIILSWVLIFIIAGLASFIMGAMGFGGGGYWTLLLIFFFLISVEIAIGTSLALSAITSMVAVAEHWRNDNIDKPLALQLTIIGAVGTVGGAFLVVYISQELLKYIIVIIFIVVGLFSLIRLRKPDETHQVQVKRKSKLLLPMGFFMGFIGGALGLSGSTPLSSYLISSVKLSPARAVGTTLTVVLLTSIVGAIVYYQRNAIDFNILLILSTACIIGAYLGAKLTPYINKKVLAITIALLSIAFGIYLAFYF
ncbi:MAG: sulfite exporter TauE/SafE family protein [Methanobacterium sp.]